MVYLYIKSTKNPVVVQLENPIEAEFIRLESLTIPNSWYNIESTGTLIYKGQIIVSVSEGAYTMTSLKKIFDDAPLGTPIFTTSIIKNEFTLQLLKHGVTFNKALTDLIRVIDFSKIYQLDIHCDIIKPCITIPKQKNTQILSRINVKGEPYEIQTYTFEKSSYREISASEHISTLTLAIKDVDDNLINFRGKTLDFVIEII